MMILKDSKAFTLIESLVAMGMIAFFSVSIGSLWNYADLTNRGSRELDTWVEIVNVTQAILRNRDFCNDSLKKSGFVLANPNPAFPIVLNQGLAYYPTHPAVLQLNQIYNQKIQITKLEFSPEIQDLGSHTIVTAGNISYQIKHRYFELEATTLPPSTPKTLSYRTLVMFYYSNFAAGPAINFCSSDEPKFNVATGGLTFNESDACQLLGGTYHNTYNGSVTLAGPGSTVYQDGKCIFKKLVVSTTPQDYVNAPNLGTYIKSDLSVSSQSGYGENTADIFVYGDLKVRTPANTYQEPCSFDMYGVPFDCPPSMAALPGINFGTPITVTGPANQLQCPVGTLLLDYEFIASGANTSLREVIVENAPDNEQSPLRHRLTLIKQNGTYANATLYCFKPDP